MNETVKSSRSRAVSSDVEVFSVPTEGYSRYRRPGSRALLFDQDELEMWLKTGRVEFESVAAPAVSPSQSALHSNTGPISVPNISASDALDIQNAGVYHRNPLYR